MTSGQEHRDEQRWVGHGRVRIRRIEDRGRFQWIAEDECGIAAMAPSKEALQRLLRQGATNVR